MALKDTWKDKVDGVDDVLAKDINSIAQSAIQSEEEIAKQATTIKGKVDKTTESYKAYGTTSGGKAHLYNVSTNGKNGAIAQYFGFEETSMNSDPGYLNTPDPKYDFNCVNKRTLENGLASKFSLPSKLVAWSLLGIGDYNAETGKYNPRLYQRDPVGCINAGVATFASLTEEIRWNREYQNLKYTLGVPDPIYPIQVANKRYVDNKVSELEHGVMNALGAQYIMVEVKDFGAHIPIPSGAMKFAYIESLGVIKGYDDDGNELGVAEVHAINVGDTEHSIDDLPKYIEIPDGTQAITLSVTPPVGTVYTQGVGGKIIFQAKVGG